MTLPMQIMALQAGNESRSHPRFRYTYHHVMDSSVCSAAVEQVSLQFGVSSTVAPLGLTLYICGLRQDHWRLAHYQNFMDENYLSREHILSLPASFLLLRPPRIFKHLCSVDSSLESLLLVSKLFSGT